MSLRWQAVCVDCADPAALGRWWADLLGWRITYEEDAEVVLEPPAGSPADRVSPDLLFLKAPEPKTVKDRLHIDLRPDDQAAEVARAEAMGATRVEIGQSEDPDTTWVVLADPEGNEFCILRVLRPEELTEA
jgi:catechol 2,3-dioxygenase-like lactoylglutathione lyase family enzyme